MADTEVTNSDTQLTNSDMKLTNPDTNLKDPNTQLTGPDTKLTNPDTKIDKSRDPSSFFLHHLLWPCRVFFFSSSSFACDSYLADSSSPILQSL